MGNEEKEVDYKQKRIRNLGTIPDSIDDMIATKDSESTETESE